MSVPTGARAREPASVAAEAMRALRAAAAASGPEWRRDELPLRAALLFVASYFVLAEVSGQLSDAAFISPWYPPVGLSLAAVLVFGLRAMPMIFIADALQLVARGQDGVLDATVQGLAQAVLWGATGILLRPKILSESPLSRMRELAWFAVIGVAIGPIVAAALGVALIFALNAGDWSEYGYTARVYAIGDAIGILSITPTLLVLSGWAHRPAAAWSAVRYSVGGRGWEGWTMLALTVAVPALVVTMWDGVLLPFAPLPIAWVAVRRGMPTAALALAVWSVAAVVAFVVAGSAVTLRETSALLISTGLLALSAGAIATERERGRARLAYLALHDDLTGLPNRLAFTERVADALRRDDRRDLAVLHVRLEIMASADVIEPQALDRVLLRAAHRLRRLTSPDATIARVGLGRFVVLFDGPDALRVEAIAAQLVAGLGRPALVDGREYLLGPVVGSARGSGAEEPESMLEQAKRAADVAGSHTGNAAVYDETMRQSAQEARELGEDLRLAFEAGALHLQYQPIVAVGDQRAVGVEALLRWNDPVRGPVGPNEFIPIAEAGGLILPIGRWVLKEACRAAVEWPTVSGRPLTVHVNLSPVQLRDEGLAEFVATTLHDSGLAPGRLCLELTESALFDDLDLAAARILELTGLGVSVVLDDFGTGASSLSWLQRLPVSALKIDRSFVSGIEDGPVDLAIVTATLGLARAIGLETVGEGVETEAQLATLRSLGCTSVQGFLICRPISGEALVEWLASPAASAAAEQPAPGVA